MSIWAKLIVFIISMIANSIVLGLLAILSVGFGYTAADLIPAGSPLLVAWIVYLLMIILFIVVRVKRTPIKWWQFGFAFIPAGKGSVDISAGNWNATNDCDSGGSGGDCN